MSYKTFNYLLSHEAIPQSFFHDLDLFYDSIIQTRQSLQIYLQNILLTATAWAQKEKDTTESGYAIERFEIYVVGESVKHCVLVVPIPQCRHVKDCTYVAFPPYRKYARYFTCELLQDVSDSSDTMDMNEMSFGLGEYTNEKEGLGLLRYIDHGKLDNQNDFTAKIIKMVYGEEK